MPPLTLRDPPAPVRSQDGRARRPSGVTAALPLFLFFVAYPLWRANALAGSPAEEMTTIFFWTTTAKHDIADQSD